MLVTGKLDTAEETARVLADDIRPIETLASQVGRTLLVRLPGDRHTRTTFEALSELLQIHRGPSLVRLQLELTKRTPPVRVSARLTSVRVRPSEPLAKAIEELCGEGSVSWQ